jgi:hypothetical protein
MGRNKNKPTKNAAAVSPAALPVGTTEVIVPALTTATNATFTQSPNPTFTQIGMIGMIGLLSTTTEAAAAEEPKVEEPVATVEEPVATVEEPVATVEEPKVEEPKVEEPKVEEPAKEAVAPLPETSGSIFGFFRRFYNSLGGAINR